VCGSDHSTSRTLHVSRLVMTSRSSSARPWKVNSYHSTCVCVCVRARANAFVITIDLGWKSISVVIAVFYQITLYVNICSLELISSLKCLYAFLHSVHCMCV